MQKIFGPRAIAAVALAACLIIGSAGAAPRQLADNTDTGPVSSTILPFGSKAPIPPDALKPRPAPVPLTPTVAPQPAAAPAVPTPAPAPAPTTAQTPPAPAPAPAPTAQAPAAPPAPVPAPAAPPAAAEGPPPAGEAPPRIILTFRGSNTIGETLLPRLAQAFLAFSGDANVSIVRSKTDPEDAMIIGSRDGRREAIFVSAHGSAFAAKGLLAHSPESPTDIGMASRRMSEPERQSLAGKADMYSPASEHVLALDGVAVIVNSQNPISSLSVAQIRDLFSGAVADWGDKQVGGTPGAVHIYARDNNSGTFDTFSSLVLRGAKLRTDATRFDDSEALSAAVAKDPNGIGFIGLPYVAANKALAVSDVGTTPIRPNRLTVATEDYALARRLFLYTAPTNTNPDIQRFVEFALSDAGQNIVAEVGFIALSLRGEAANAGPGLAPEYVALTRRAQRLSTDFRFQFNSSALDNRGLRDMTRLADYLATQKITPSHVLLIGFGDNLGSPQGIRTVSEARARSVAAALRQEGVIVGQAVGLGAIMPVADNGSEDGRAKNRRVEVYVLP